MMQYAVQHGLLGPSCKTIASHRTFLSFFTLSLILVGAAPGAAGPPRLVLGTVVLTPPEAAVVAGVEKPPMFV